MDYYYSNKKNSDHASSYEGVENVRLKVCGMGSNTAQVAFLKPDYIGFIFWEPSKRHFNGEIPQIPHSVKRVGVFVDASINTISKKVKDHGFQYVQLHGKESPAFCDELKKRLPQLKIIKVFSVNDDFEFGKLRHFEDVCDFYLFDTKGELPGGNGFTFNWQLLKDYPSTKPYFLSGGIGMDELNMIKEFLKTPASKYCYAIDVNSRFEIEPGLKDLDKLREFKNEIEFSSSP